MFPSPPRLVSPLRWLSYFMLFLVLGHSVGLAAGRPKASHTIDAMIQTRLKEQHLKPSLQADDAEFLRRAYLDLTGTIPTPEQVQEFLQKGSRHKRQETVETLLASEAFFDYWALLWTNLLLTRTPAGIVNRDALESWLRDAFARNVPYDQLATQLLTAEGPNDQVGPTNFFLNYDLSPIDLTAKTARLFLGVPIQCAQCHDHKTEKWTQEDFYGYAAFFTDIRRERIQDPTDANRTLGYRIVRAQPRPMTIPGGETVAPRFLDGTPGPVSMASRREALSRWITDRQNPYFSQAIVNRLWAHFFGKGFVEPLDGFGIENPPSHPKLLRWLAEDFVTHGYDLRYLMRVILNTEAYQRTSQTNESNRDDTTYFSHALLKPLNPEQLFNALLQATGFERFHKLRHRQQLDQLRRTYRDRFVFLFGNNDTDSQVESFTGTIPQALMMINGNVVTQGTQRIKGNQLDRILQRTRTPRRRIERIYLQVLSRKPTQSEVAAFMSYMRGYTDARLAYEDLYWALLNSSEFLNNH